MEKYSHGGAGALAGLFPVVPKAPKLYQNQAPSARLGRAMHDRSRPTARQRGYDRAHEKWRDLVLARDRVCKHCNRRLAVEADHIVPVAAGGKRLALDNGQGLCKPCHTAKTNRERAAGLLASS